MAAVPRTAGGRAAGEEASVGNLVDAPAKVVVGAAARVGANAGARVAEAAQVKADEEAKDGRNEDGEIGIFGVRRTDGRRNIVRRITVRRTGDTRMTARRTHAFRIRSFSLLVVSKRRTLKGARRKIYGFGTRKRNVTLTEIDVFGNTTNRCDCTGRFRQCYRPLFVSPSDLWMV